MTEQEKQIQIALGTYLLNEWIECKKLFKKFYDLKDTVSFEERVKILNEGEQRFIQAVKEVYGEDMTPLQWASTPPRGLWKSCTLSNGMVFE